MKKIGRILVPLVSVLCIVGLDQLVKYLTIQYLSDGREVKILGDALVLTYVQNRGMAWGLFQNGQVVFVILTPIAIAAVIFLYVRTPWEIEYRPIRIAEVMLVGGALGNLIDRIFRYDPVDGSLFNGYVVDMIYIKAIHFPVFNVADIFVTLSFVAMMLLLLFVYNDEEFNKCFGNFPPKKKVTEGSEEEGGESEEKEDEPEEPEKTEESEELPDDTAADGQEINHENN